MIVVFYLENMSSKPMGEFHENMASFARDKFNIVIDDEGHITIDGNECPTSYKLGDDANGYTKEEVFREFTRSGFFKAWAKSRFWTVYKTEKII